MAPQQVPSITNNPSFDDLYQISIIEARETRCQQRNILLLCGMLLATCIVISCLSSSLGGNNYLHQYNRDNDYRELQLIGRQLKFPFSQGGDGSSESCEARIPFFRDADGDGYGDPNDVVEACHRPSGYVQNANDCDDTSPLRNPKVVDEICHNDLDDNCNGEVDEGCASDDHNENDAEKNPEDDAAAAAEKSPENDCHDDEGCRRLRRGRA